MKKLFVITIGIVLLLTLILPTSIMAAGNHNPGKPDASLPHYDVNFVTGLTDSSYQVLVSKTAVTEIKFVFTTAVSERYIYDYNGTDGYAEVWLPAGYYWELYAQARGKVGTKAVWYGGEYESTRLLTWGDPIATGTGPDEWVFLTEYTYEGCSNFATRWCYFPIT